MWRFILLTFVFLGWVFYELSGGADYEPRATPPQDRAEDTAEEAPRTAQRETIVRARADPRPTEDITEDGGGPERDMAATAALDDDAPMPGQPDTATPPPDENAQEDPVPPGPGPSPDPNRDPSSLTVSGVLAGDFRGARANLDAEALAHSLANLDQMDFEPSPEDIRTVTQNSANMRTGPGTSYNLVDRLTRGTDIEVLSAPGGGWIKMRVVETGRIGWLSAQLVSDAGN